MEYSGVNQTIEQEEKKTTNAIGIILSDGEAALLQLLTAANGTIKIYPPQLAYGRSKWGKLAFDCNIENTNGNAIATIQLNGTGSPIDIVLPDNRFAATLMVQSHCASDNLSGAVGPYGGEFIVKWANNIRMCTGQLHCGCYIEEGGKPVFSLVPPNHYWVPPFVIGTACLGAFCVGCMVSGPMHNIDMAGESQGTVQRSTCGGGNPMYVHSQNIRALRASISALTLVNYCHAYSDKGQV